MSDIPIDHPLRSRLDLRRARYTQLREAVRDGYLDVMVPPFEDCRVLIVGDRPGPSAPENVNEQFPFYSVKHCSGWLNKQVDALNLPEDKLVWINSAKKDGTPEDPHMIHLAWADHVIALGGNAEAWLRKHDVDHHKVAHPQYWKRFHSKEPYPLFNLLTQLLEEPCGC